MAARQVDSAHVAKGRGRRGDARVIRKVLVRVGVRVRIEDGVRVRVGVRFGVRVRG